MSVNVMVLDLGNSKTMGTLGLRIPDLKQNCLSCQAEQTQRLGYGVGRGSVFRFSSDDLNTCDNDFQLSKT